MSRYKHFWANDHKFITYDRLITDYTSGEYLGNFDVEAGTFTAGTAGISQFSCIAESTENVNVYMKQDSTLSTSVAQFPTILSTTILR